WLSTDAGKAISIGTSVWKANERIVGVYYAVRDQSVVGGWRLRYETLTTSPNTLHLAGEHQVDGVKPLSLSWSQVKDAPITLTGAMAKVFSERGTSIAIATQIPWVWSMARKISDDLKPLESVPEE